jgi:LPXTG-site transpeptidase (sortase) family protein
VTEPDNELDRDALARMRDAVLRRIDDALDVDAGLNETLILAQQSALNRDINELLDVDAGLAEILDPLAPPATRPVIVGRSSANVRQSRISAPSRRILLPLAVATIIAVPIAVAAMYVLQRPAPHVTGPVTPLAGTGYARLSHVSPSSPAVDLYLTGPAGSSVTIRGNGYGTQSDYQALATGEYTAAVRVAGAPSTSPPLASDDVEIRPDTVYTFTGLSDVHGAAVGVTADVLPRPAPGMASVRIVQASAVSPVVDVFGAGAPLNVHANVATIGPYRDVASGPISLRATSPSTGATAVVDATLTAGFSYTVVISDIPNHQLALRIQTDTWGPAAVPAGAIDTGGGGTADQRWSTDAVAGSVLILALIVLLGGRSGSGRRRLSWLVLAVLMVQFAAVPASLAAPTAEPALGSPGRIVIPAIGLDVPMDTTTVDANGHVRPPNFGHVAWYVDGVVPGDPGPAVIAGHLDSTAGPAVFYHLHELRIGDEIIIERGGTQMTFRVNAVRAFPKAVFPTALVYGPTRTAELRLVTCGGPFDAQRLAYMDNIIVFATRVYGH